MELQDEENREEAGGGETKTDKEEMSVKEEYYCVHIIWDSKTPIAATSESWLLQRTVLQSSKNHLNELTL